MMRYSINKIKGYFSVAIILLVTLMIGGTFVFTNQKVQAVFQPHLSRRYFDKTLDYLHYAFAGKFTEAAPVVEFAKKDRSTLLAEHGSARSIPVLTYHGIVAGADGANVLVENFRQQMFALKQAGYETVSLVDFQKFLRGEETLPDKSFLLTFDDGRKDSYYPVDPILQVLNYEATIFIISGHALRETSRYYLSKEELKSMLRSGRWTIGSHGDLAHQYYPIDAEGTRGHFMSNKLWLADQQRLETDEEFRQRMTDDLLRSKQDLEKELGITIASYAYPFGDYGQGTLNFPGATEVVAEAMGPLYDMAFYQLRGANDYTYHYPGHDRLTIGRIGVGITWTADQLLAVLTQGTDKVLPWATDFPNDDGWLTPWGQTKIVDTTMQMSTSPFTTGALTFLNGAYLWEDYEMQAQIQTVQAQAFAVIARYQDKLNYIACKYVNGGIRIDQVVDGEEITLVRWLNRRFVVSDATNLAIGIEVIDNRARCLLNGKTVVSTRRLNPQLKHGGVGFLVWDPVVNTAALTIENISVASLP